MQVYKFGGASVKNAEAIRNLQKIIQPLNYELIIVVSAMDKITNAFENLYEELIKNSNLKWELFKNIKSFHINICNELFFDNESKSGLFLNDYFNEIEAILNSIPADSYDFGYDQLIPFGELLSTKIIFTFLKQTNKNIEFLDIRNLLCTDNTYREARIDWDKSKILCVEYFKKNSEKLIITQGFIGRNSENFSTTLGREGSDFTAAILAYLLDAESVSIWKDVPGIMTADPALFQKVEKIDKLSYKEAIELAFYGAKVIHPRTVKPLENKRIPLYVKSFINPYNLGTCISHYDEFIKYPPIYILKKNQILFSISPKDFSFIAEDHISKIFALLNKHRTHVNLMQNSAISFSVCADINSISLSQLIADLQKDFSVLYNKDLTLITIRHYTDEAIERMVLNKIVLLEQKSRNTVRFIVQS